MYIKVYKSIFYSLKIPILKALYEIGTIVDDVHHIKEQKKSDEKGFIGHVNQNHKYNLIPLCKKHHKLVHEGKININGFVTTSKGLELHYTSVK